MPQIKLFMGEQDGLELHAVETPEVLWVLPIEAQRKLTAMIRAGGVPTPEFTKELSTLPYVRHSKSYDEEGEEFVRYEFCAEMLLHEPDSAP